VRTESRRGLVYALGAYTVWGVFPLYFPLLEPANAEEILAHRIFWSGVVSAVLFLVPSVRRGFGRLLRDRRRVRYLALAAVVLSVNWYVYIWAANHAHVVEASLGYYINPLVTVLLGVIVLRERLRALQWAALGLGFVSVVWLSIDAGRLPWIALALAFSFGSYGLFKKKADAPAVQSLAVETGVLAPFALGYLVWLTLTGAGTFAGDGPGHALLLASAGVVTTVPLVFFAAAATRIPLSTMGLLQYLTPTLQLGVAAFLTNEPMTSRRLVGFVLVWAALVVLGADGLRAGRRMIRDRPPGGPAAGADPLPSGTGVSG